MENMEKRKLIIKLETTVSKINFVEGELCLLVYPPLAEEGAIYDFEIPETKIKGRAVFDSKNRLKVWEMGRKYDHKATL